jgi:phosphatidylserine/phosphatidylglycerophosphate/cardiolipin synthase-like enzyme
MRAFFVGCALLALFAFGACTKHHTDPSDADVPPDDASASDEPATVTSAVQIIVEPSDNAQGLVTAMKLATTSIHMTMYLLSSDTVINALIAQHKAGLDVRVVLNQNFPDTTSSNADVFTQLQNAGVGVVWAPSSFTYTHEKAVILDGATAWIMTMNLTYSSPTSNREYLAIDTDADDVAEADSIFEADYANTTATPTGKLLVAPINARDGMLPVIANAQSTLDVEAEEMSDQAIVTAIIAAHDRGVAVRMILSDDTPTSAQASAVQSLEQDGVDVRMLSDPYVHAKTFVADGVLAYVGSENFTANSLDSNRELGLVLDTASEIAKIESTIDTDFGAAVPY